MDISLSINALLMDVMKSVHGLKQIMVSDSTGLVLAKISKEKDTTDFEGIASISTALYLGMASVKLGELGFSQTIFSDGNLCLHGISKTYVLIVITQTSTPIKQLRTAMEKISDSISKQLELYYQSLKIERKQEEVCLKEGFLSDSELDAILNELSFD